MQRRRPLPRLLPLRGEDGAGPLDVAADLAHELIDGVEARLVAEALDELDTQVSAVQVLIAVEIDDVRLDGGALVAERRVHADAGRAVVERLAEADADGIDAERGQSAVDAE